MELDDEICLCFHVTKRKVLSWLRVERPQRAAQLSECYGAGTGCGWCRATLQHYFDQARSGLADEAEIDRDAYAHQRSRYIRSGKGTPPPGATPPGD